MKISQIYIYPVKSLRGISLTESQLTPQGLAYDRRFMLLKVDSTSPRKFKNMHVVYFPELTLFFTGIHKPNEEKEDRGDNSDESVTTGEIIVRYKPPKPTSTENSPLHIPLYPSITGLEEMNVRMHDSPTEAYNMGYPYNNWFSHRLGYPVILAYIGPNLRPILGNLSPKAAASPPKWQSWLSAVTSYLPSLHWSTPENHEREGLTFADAAAILVVNEASLHDVSRRLPEGEEMDITKFRPNIVVSGSDTAWDEDYWGEITCSHFAKVEEVRIILTQNCARCQSINIDYATGRPGRGESGKVLKMLMGDRRVDPGTKYSPIFGRYGFLGEGERVKIGDEVKVSKRNRERTHFDWPALNN